MGAESGGSNARVVEGRIFLEGDERDEGDEDTMGGAAIGTPR